MCKDGGGSHAHRRGRVHPTGAAEKGDTGGLVIASPGRCVAAGVVQVLGRVQVLVLFGLDSGLPSDGKCDRHSRHPEPRHDASELVAATAGQRDMIQHQFQVRVSEDTVCQVEREQERNGRREEDAAPIQEGGNGIALVK